MTPVSNAPRHPPQLPSGPTAPFACNEEKFQSAAITGPGANLVPHSSALRRNRSGPGLASQGSVNGPDGESLHGLGQLNSRQLDGVRVVALDLQDVVTLRKHPVE